MKHLLTTAFVTAAFALPLAAAAQERYPALNPDQLSPEQKAYDAGKNDLFPLDVGNGTTGGAGATTAGATTGRHAG